MASTHDVSQGFSNGATNGSGGRSFVERAPDVTTRSSPLPRHVRRRWRRLGTGGRLAGVAVVLAALYALGAQLPFWFLDTPQAGAAFFPPAGLTLAVLVLTPRRSWPLWLVVVAGVEIIVDLAHDVSVPMTLGFALANTVEPLVGATALRLTASRGRSLFDGLVRFVVCGAVLGPIVGATIAATAATAFGDSGVPWAEVTGRWALGDALGVIVVAAPIFSWWRVRPSDLRPSAGLLTCTTLIAVAVTIVPAVLWQHPMIYAVLPILMWAGFRGGTRAVTTAGFGVAFTAGWAAVTGRAGDLIAAVDGDDALVFVQLFLAVTLLAALTFAVEAEDRRRAERVLREAESQRARAELMAAEAASGERRRIARETHDIVGHALNVMLLQAGAARRALNDGTARSADHLASLELAGRDAFRDLDVALGLADRSSGRLPGRGLASVSDLVKSVEEAGVAVALRVAGRSRALPTLVDWSAYRILQEALTNVVKHAPTARTTVTIVFSGDEVRLAVVDDGQRSATAAAGGGRGLIGMRERAAVLGGVVHAGPEPGGGFAVRASLPAKEVAR